jgi:hypothetical protein
MARGMKGVVMVAIALALAGCASREAPIAAPGDLGLDCVWNNCPAKSIAMSRCASQTTDTPGFLLCMRYEGYQARACDAGTPDCTPKVNLLR